MTYYDRKWTPWRNGKRTSAANWRKPRTWNRKAEERERCRLYPDWVRPRVMVNADWLDPEVPAEWLADLLALIVATPHLDWLLLTKRPELWRRGILGAVVYADDGVFDAVRNLTEDWLFNGKPPANVWIGYSAPTQADADRGLPHLLAIPARVRFLSCEPLLEHVVLPAREVVVCTNCGEFNNTGGGCEECGASEVQQEITEAILDGIDWVIAGGESGPGARPCHPDWARSLRDQCQAAGVAFFFKQWGAWRPGGSLPAKPDGRTIAVHAAGMTAWTPDNPHNPLALGHPGWRVMERVGKKAAGRRLDGRTWDEVPS